MQSRDEQLIALAKTYASEEDFKAKNLPKYLLTKQKRLLRIAFPKEHKSTKDIKGLYYLYKGGTLIYLNYSFTDCITAIKEETIVYDAYKIRPMYSDADIIVVYYYLSHLFKPKLNTNIEKNGLNLFIPNDTLRKVWGKSIRGKTL